MQRGSLKQIVDIALVALVFVVPAQAAHAQDQVKLKDGTEFSAATARKKGDFVLIQVPRADVASINGEPVPPPVAVGAQAPAFSVVGLKGDTITAPGADSPTLVQFWASWCPYCRKDVDIMQKLQATYGPHGLKIVSLSMDQDLDKFKTFLEENALPYPVAVLNAKENIDAKVAESYEAQGVPNYFLIDGKGKIAQNISGSIADQPAIHVELIKAIRGVLSQAGLSLPPEEVPEAKQPEALTAPSGV